MNGFDWTSIQGILSVIGTVLAATALIYSIKSFNKSLRFIHYGEIDKNYFELLKIAFENPYVNAPGTITTQQEAEKYDLYAFMMWNFLEAIYDRGINDAELRDTWMPIVQMEGRRHQAWLEKDEHATNFKQDFVAFVRRDVFK